MKDFFRHVRAARASLLVGVGDEILHASVFANTTMRMAARLGARSAAEAAKRLTATPRGRQAAAAGAAL